MIAANQDTVFRRLCGAMDQPELATDDRFVNHVARGRNQDELDKIIGDWAAQRQPTDIIATLSEVGVISGPINTVAEVVTIRSCEPAECSPTTGTNASVATYLDRGSFRC